MSSYLHNSSSDFRPFKPQHHRSQVVKTLADLTTMVLSPGETSRRESGAATSASGEGEGEAGQTRSAFSRRHNVRVSVEQRWLLLRCVTRLCALQEEKERKEQEEQRKKLDEDAKKKKVLSNMTQQYGAAQKVQTLRITVPNGLTQA